MALGATQSISCQLWSMQLGIEIKSAYNLQVLLRRASEQLQSSRMHHFTSSPCAYERIPDTRSGQGIKEEHL